jgi:LmbE family N-acetylglucosaminyl deacetylase
MDPTRRHLLSSGIRIGTMASVLGAAETSSAAEGPAKLKIVVTGGHPGDPEAACGGTMARLADLGHEVVALYLTRGERGLPGKTTAEAAAIRTGEAQRACAILTARPLFLKQADADTVVSGASYEEFRHLLETEKPQIVFTHWPIDAHRDHRATSLLAYDAWLRGGKPFALYYYEVSTGEETQHFHPTDYVNITATESRKRAACFLHASQQPAKFYAYHEKMHNFRGFEAGCRRAEAFLRHEQSPAIPLPG